SRRFFLIPLRPPRPPLFPYTTLFRSPLAIVRNNGKILLHRWAAEGILAGLWELPGGEAKRGESSRNSLRRHLRGLHGALTDEIRDRKSTRLNSSHVSISYAVFCLKKK